MQSHLLAQKYFYQFIANAFVKVKIMKWKYQKLNDEESI